VIKVKGWKKDLRYYTLHLRYIALNLVALLLNSLAVIYCLRVTSDQGCDPDSRATPFRTGSQSLRAAVDLLLVAFSYSIMRDAVAQKLRLSTTATHLDLCYSAMSRENVQQLKAVLRQNTALESLDLRSISLGSAGLAEIAPVLYRNTSIKVLDLRHNGLDDVESADALRELIRHNKTITRRCRCSEHCGWCASQYNPTAA
jgi:hypothetical protein